MTKVCFKCNRRKALSEFYKHPMMSDGHLNKCKDCAKVDVSRNRKKNIDYYRDYDQRRGGRRTAEDQRRYRSSNKIKYAAHLIVARAIKLKTMVRV